GARPRGPEGAAGAMSDPLFLAALFALGVLSGGTAAVVGFGIGSLLTPFLLARMAPQEAVAAVALPHLLATAVRLVQHRRAVDRGVFLRFGLPSAVFSLAGAFLLARVASPLLTGGLGLLLLATGAANLTRGFGQWTPPLPVALALGALSGLFGGLAGNQGGLRAAGLMAFRLDPRAFLATGTAVALVIDLARTPVYLARGAGLLAALAPAIAVAAAGCLVARSWASASCWGCGRSATGR
ncbi:MAG TPA: sulfite exporter TauE/SafE family protein, partial [Vicinamibacteria bacterium]|nr:sulfite exporter TauE/SafE family protein [Vicinamibacteria bacterium]